MTGERELLTGGSEARGFQPGWGFGSGVKNPTWRTLGSLTVLEARRASMEREERGFQSLGFWDFGLYSSRERN